MKPSKHFGLAVFLAAGLFSCVNVFAASAKETFSGIGLSRQSNSDTWKAIFPTSTIKAADQVIAAVSSPSYSTVAGGISATNAATAAIGNYKVPLTATAVVSESALLTGVKSLFTPTAAGIALQVGILAAPYVYDWLKDSGIEPGPDGNLQVTDPSGSVQSTGMFYGVENYQTITYSTKDAACKALNINTGSWVYKDGAVDPNDSWRCEVKTYSTSGQYSHLSYFNLSSTPSTCPAGNWTNADGTGCSAVPTGKVNISPNATINIADATSTSLSVNISTKYKAMLLPEIWDLCYQTDGCDETALLDATKTATVTGPSTVNGQKTSTKSGNTTTTTQKSLDLTYDGDQVKAQEKTTTTRTTTNPETGETTTETEEGSADPEATPDDTPLPDQPVLYERKYPDGIVGVWRDKKEQMTSTKLTSFLNSAMPTWNSGTCPSWSLPLNFGSWANYSTRSVQVDCDVWSFIRIIVLVGALILSRKIVVGG